ncbi:MipA/OmpV family protein [Jannaschia sp. LMIT008]|uniref:MipA/OmpV family protein n=1 Tax=Jannaschia maritima TaxID=3032585 RepID=UPI0028117734|nr:MipA/OmpV family protein [Jannaschia sp. LMIT008]
MIRPIALLLMTATAATAQQAADAPLSTTVATQGAGSAIGFTLRAGVAARPDYFGSDSAEAAADLGFSLNYLRLGGLEFGNPDPLYVPEGFRVTGSLRYVGDRDDDDNAELAGLDDVDASLELGAGLAYGTRDYQVFGAVRYGVIGHEAWVGEVGGDVFFRPNDQLTLRMGPRAFFGSNDYADTYFGVSGAESIASNGNFTSFDPGGGLISTGVELGAGYRFNEDWGVDAAVRYDRYRRDAADSPILQDDDTVSARIGITRRFTFGF